MKRLKDNRMLAAGRRLALMLLTLFAAASCIDDGSGDDPGKGPVAPVVPDKDKRVQVQIDLSPDERVAAGTRDPGDPPDADKRIDNLWVMSFDDAGRMTDAPAEAAELSDGKWVTMLAATEQQRRVVLLANATAALETYKDINGDWMVMGGDDVNNTNVTRLAHMADAMTGLRTVDLGTVTYGGTRYISAQPEATAAGVSPSYSVPMYAEVTLDRINALTLISASEDEAVKLRRATAKFTVTVSGVSNFTIQGASLGNAPLHGLLIPPPESGSIPASDNVYHYFHAASDGSLPFVGVEADGVTSKPLYSYEYNNTGNENVKKLCVLLKAAYKGKSGWYRLDITDEKAADGTTPLLDIERNKHYTITVRHVDAPGYATADEAAANRAANIEYTLNVTGSLPNSPHDIVSNGDYYLGTSNSEYVLYGGSGKSLPAATITHSATSAVTTGTISVQGTGVTLTAENTYATSISPDSKSLTFNPGTTNNFTIMVLMMSPTSSPVSTMTVQIGNLTKEIKMIHRPVLSYTGGILTEFIDGDTVGEANGTAGVYSEAICDSGEFPSWLRFSAYPDGSHPVADRLISGSGKVYLWYERNSTRYDNTARFFLSRKNAAGAGTGNASVEAGRVCVIVWREGAPLP